MGIFSFITGGEAVDMARKVVSEPNREIVSTAIGRLTAAGTNEDAFQEAFLPLEALSAVDIAAIASGYAPVGTKATSKKASLSKIKKRFVELVRLDAKNKAAAKVKPW